MVGKLGWVIALGALVTGCDGSSTSTSGGGAPYVIVLNGLTGNCPAVASTYGNGPYAWTYNVVVDGEDLPGDEEYPTARVDLDAGNHSIGIKGGYIGCYSIVASVDGEFVQGHRYLLLLWGAADTGNGQEQLVDVTDELIPGRRDLVLANLATDSVSATFSVDGVATSVPMNGYRIMPHPGAGKPVEIAERPGVSHTLSDFPLMDEFLVVLDSSIESTMSVVQAGFAD